MIEDFIARWAAATPDKVAVAMPGRQVTYGQLWKLIGQRSQAFRSTGIGPRRIVALRTRQDVDFLADYCALHLVGAVAMPLEHDMPQELFRAIDAHYGSFAAPDGAADVLFTTGTTGTAKGVLVSHSAIEANAENLTAAHGYSPQHTFVVCGPLNHIGSLSKVWPVFMQGATLYVLEGMKDLEAFFSALSYSPRLMATFMVPASLRMVLLLGARQLARHADALDFIETGAAPMARGDMERLCQLLPGTRLYNTYASTETGIICTHNYNTPDHHACQPHCLGRPMRHSEVFITPEGTVACKGATLMMGYVGDDERTRLVMHDGAVFTADCGTIDEQGCLHLTGRMDDVINVGGYKVAPAEVEQAALSHPMVSDCVCVAVPSALTGSALKLLVVVAPGQRLDKNVLASHLAQCIESHKVPRLYEQVDFVVRNANGKIDRKAYRS